MLLFSLCNHASEGGIPALSEPRNSAGHKELDFDEQTSELAAAEESAGEVTGAGRPDFVKVEKNLSSMGFFTPSKSRGKIEVREKVMTFRREAEGKAIETTATILPSAKYGLPTTADQDKFFAFQKIVGDRRKQSGTVENPIAFTSKELLEILEMQDAGKNYQEIYEWLQRMTLTGIHSRGVVYMAGRKFWASDTFHVFDRAVGYGMDLGAGRIADRNYVWLSGWQLENINNNYLMPVDLESYRRLRGNIAKALVPLLQIWLYASRSHGVFEKRYEDLCVILNIKEQVHLSHMKKQLGPSLDELVEHGYLSSWTLDPTFDGRSYKLVANHGEKFFTDQRLRLTKKYFSEPQGPIEASPSLLHELTGRGIGERQARQLLRELPEEQPVRLQLVWIDHLLVIAGKRIHNPPGFYVSLLRENIRPPEWFEEQQRASASPRLADEETAAWLERLDREDRYSRYKRTLVQDHIDQVLSQEAFEQLVADRMKAEKAKYGSLPDHTLREIAGGLVRRDLESHLHLIDFESFCRSPQIEMF